LRAEINLKIVPDEGLKMQLMDIFMVGK